METNKSISTVIIIIIAFVVAFLFVLPKYHESNSSETTLRQKQKEYESQSAYYVKISDLLKSVEQRQDALIKINSALPDDIALAPIVYFLQKKADDNILIVKSITFLRVSQADYNQTLATSSAGSSREVKDVIFSANLSGSYQSLKNFLYDLEKSSRLFEVNSIALTPLKLQQNRFQEQAYDFKLEVKTHAY